MLLGSVLDQHGSVTLEQFIAIIEEAQAHK
jgi:hypothetical protein